MGDSDEEYDRRRGRDKFRGERNDYDARRPPPRAYDRARGERVRTSHENNSWENKGSKRDYYGRDAHHERRDSFGRNSSPPSKRSRREWEEQSPWRGAESNALVPHESKINGSPSLMGFKEFILQQEDDIDESEAVRRYQEYKVEFKRTQINDFFVLQKDKEWFKEKYHPVESNARKAVIRSGLRKRLRIFLDLYEAGFIDNFSLTIDASSEVLKFLDRVIVKLEGGTKEDVEALDIPPIKEKVDVKTDGDGASKDEERGEKKQYGDQGADQEDDAKEPLPPGMEDGEELDLPGMDEEEKVIDKNDGADDKKNDEEMTDASAAKNDDDKYVYDGLHLKRPVSLFMRNIPSNVSRHDLVTVCERYPGYLRVALSDPSPDRRWARRAWATFEHTVNIKDICWNLSNIRIKDCELAPVVNREVSHRIRPVNGITCSPMTMQLDAKFALDLIQILDKKYRLYENDELTNNQITDISTESSVIKIQDDTNEVKEVKEEESVKKKVEEEFELPKENPITKNLPSDIIEAAPMKIKDEEDGKIEHTIVVDKKLEKSLDLLLLYLRVVHCVDYYNANEYLHEDEMPIRCGIMHVRDQPILSASKKDVDEWFQNIKSKLEHIFNDDELAADDEAMKLGKKDEEVEVENFIKANTQELTPDKWLCPLSGKKFRGPDYIRKHIMMKHLSSVENVKTEVMFFNNYVYDSKRPCFPDPKLRVNQTTTASFTPVTTNRTWMPSARQSGLFATPRPPLSATAVYPATTPQPPVVIQETYGRMSTYPPKQRRGGAATNFRERKIIKYRDLDAPEETDFF